MSQLYIIKKNKNKNNSIQNKLKNSQQHSIKSTHEDD